MLNHFDTEGPLGLPMKDVQARRLEIILNELPAEDRAMARLVSTRPPSEVLAGERADVSWITTEEVDREREIVVAAGMDESHFRLNPIVTLQHSYQLPPVGKSVWRKRARDGAVVGIKAKTRYPVKPQDWTDPWPADTAFALVKAGLMNGKSIGFLRLKSHAPTAQELRTQPELAGVSRIIDRWLLLEYSCVFLPCNQAALVEQVSKGEIAVPETLIKIIGADCSPHAPREVAAVARDAANPHAEREVHNIIPMPFVSEDEIRHMIRRRLRIFNPQAIVDDAVERAKGRI
jgi:hypothetical protein